MVVKIQTYRGWTISFDCSLNTFCCHSEQYSNIANRKSYLGTKQFIDDFIKENEKFVPVWIEKKPDPFGNYEKLLIIGLRRDGKFVYEGKGKQKQTISDYDEESYILFDEANQEHRVAEKKITQEINKLFTARKKLLSKIKGMSLADYRKSLTK